MSETLLKTPLHDKHVSAGATMGPEDGWAVPLRYGSPLDEALAIRSRAGLSDLSHMGRLRLMSPTRRTTPPKTRCCATTAAAYSISAA